MKYRSIRGPLCSRDLESLNQALLLLTNGKTPVEEGFIKPRIDINAVYQLFYKSVELENDGNHMPMSPLGMPTPARYNTYLGRPYSLIE